MKVFVRYLHLESTGYSDAILIPKKGVGFVAQWITRMTTEQEIPGSTHGKLELFSWKLRSLKCFYFVHSFIRIYAQHQATMLSFTYLYFLYIYQIIRTFEFPRITGLRT